VFFLYCMGIFDFALIFINLFNLNLVRDDSMFALYPKARFCVYLVFGMDMLRWFVLTPCALIWVFGTDEEKNRATNRSFIHDMVSRLFFIFHFFVFLISQLIIFSPFFFPCCFLSFFSLLIPGNRSLIVFWSL